MPKITFGIIVVNGEPFIRYNLRSLYPWAHQIIIVEGACRTAKAVATPEGHSIDGTLQSLQRFQAEEDTEKKVILVHARDEGFKDGFWPEKTEMCQAFARRATGDFLWQIDSDEFYREEDMPEILKLLENGAGRITFPQHSFWGGIDYVNNGLALAEFDRGISGARVFAWGKGFRYTQHRPPTVEDQDGRNVSLRGDLTAPLMAKQGIFRYHFSLVFPSLVFTKVGYYSVASQEKAEQGGGFNSNIHSWHESNFKRITDPYRLHNIPGFLSWIRPFRGTHPQQIVKMMSDIRSGRVSHELRADDDACALMRSCRYRASTWILDWWVVAVTSRFGRPIYFLWCLMLSQTRKVIAFITRSRK